MGDIDNNEYGFPAHMWCGRKHLSLNEVHAYELQSKIEADCRGGECAWTNPTRKKADKIVNHMLAFEEHMADVIQKGGEDSQGTVASLQDEARRVRQEIVNTGVVFDSSSGVKPLPGAKEVMQKLGAKISAMKKRIDQMASVMKQDQAEPTSYSMESTEPTTVPQPDPEPTPTNTSSGGSIFAVNEDIECDTCKEDIGAFEAEIGRVDVSGSIFG
jgi:hypothetical protein